MPAFHLNISILSGSQILIFNSGGAQIRQNITKRSASYESEE